MRTRPETILITVMAVFAALGVTAVLLDDTRLGAHDPVPGVETMLVDPFPGSADGWFVSSRPHCNPVEVETHLRARPAPDGPRGRMYEAGCLALAGEVEAARWVIDGLSPDLRDDAAGLVFQVVHPAADAGGDVAAGLAMELVVQYLPSHPMALYHAGAGAWERGDDEAGRGYLERFLAVYPVEDGWRASAVAMLEATGA